MLPRFTAFSNPRVIPSARAMHEDFDHHMQGPRMASALLPDAVGPINSTAGITATQNTARKSLTLVRVGPVTTE